ncbi:MAG: branched-chain amino acid ABC transporter substrate-binding protein, partial [Hyphomicrobiaceae bacterium]|nr:branched-chain amino acid ABC transporter substrate-binding protein [Hyphomicrobiaceae bacterium]
EEGIIQISPASTNPKLTDQRAGPNVYRVCGRDDQQGQVAGEYLAKHYAGKKIAILHDKTAYGKGLADETRKYMNKAGLKETMYEAYTAGEKDYTALVSKMKQAGIDVVYIGGYHTEAGLIVRQMRDQGLKAQLVSGDALVTLEYWKVSGPAGEGTLMTFSPDPRKSPAAKDLVAKFRANKIEPEGYVLYTYAAIQAWAQAVTAAKTTAADKVIPKLNAMEFTTVLGKFKFDKKGDPNLPPYKFYKWTAGKYDQIN